MWPRFEWCGLWCPVVREFQAAQLPFQGKCRLESAEERTSKDEGEQLPRVKMTARRQMIDMVDVDCPDLKVTGVK